MRKRWSVVRYSSIGVFFAGIITVIQGCSVEREGAFFAALLFLLSFCSAPVETTPNSNNAGTPPVPATTLYWSDFGNDTIVSGPIDGSGAPTVLFNLIDGVDNPGGIAYDADRVYWLNRGTDEVFVGNADGTGVPIVLYNNGDGVDNPFALDVDGGFLYWSQEAGGTEDQIVKAPASGAGPITVLYDETSDGLGCVQDIDIVGNNIYWADECPDELVRGTIDGTGAATILFDDPSDGLDCVRGVVVNANDLFFVDECTNLIGQANADGSGVLNTLFNGFGLSDIEFDSGFLYWRESNQEIARGNADGTGVPVILFDAGDGLGFIFSIATD